MRTKGVHSLWRTRKQTTGSERDSLFTTALPVIYYKYHVKEETTWMLNYSNLFQ